MAAEVPHPPQPPLWARDAGGAVSRRLSRESIVAAAIELAGAEGLGAVTLRRLAGELGARPMSLYNHVSSKDDLLDLMFDEVAGQTVLAGELPAGWRPGLRALAHRVREVGLRHPWSVEILGLRPPLGPNTMRLLNEWVAALRELALPAHQAWGVVTAVNDYVTGYVVREAALRRLPGLHPDGAGQWRAAVHGYLGELADSGEYPDIEPLLRAGFAAAPDNFDTGLTWQLDAIGARYATACADQAKRAGSPAP